MPLRTTTENIEIFNTGNPVPVDMSLSLKQIRRELLYTEYEVKSAPGIVLRFLPQGILHITSPTRTIPIIHQYNISHNDKDYFMEIEPSLMEEPVKMRLMIIKDHMTLHSTRLEEDDNPTEILYLVKLRAYPFKSRKY